MPSITKHGKQWRAHVYKYGIRKTKVFEIKREALAWSLATEAELEAKKSFGRTFGDTLDKYEADVTSKKEGKVWEVRRLNAMRVYFGDYTQLRDIDRPQIAEWRDHRLKTVSGSTVVREANILRNIFAVARNEWQWIEHEPFKGVKLPAENDSRHQVWPWQLIRRVLRAERSGKTKEMQLAFHIALRTGMRLAEVLGAPEAFDIKRHVVVIKTKTEKRAEIPIGRIGTKLLTGVSFTVGANEASVLFSRLCRELLITDLTFHDARATALTHLARKVDVLTLAKISRHRNLSLLSNVYYRESPDSIAKRI
jgi:integrase